ncbi:MULTISPECIES: PfkB family carbohydrate kinase [Gilliamella]|uniref:PfkB family carbohydrate kinase n=1 Tax=Gilliamella sp. W8126 TaxID=2750946 RepID=UPI0018DE07E9
MSKSLPQNIKPEYFQSILKICQSKNIEIILDISHPILQDLLTYKPLLIKPNNDELTEIFGLTIEITKRIIITLEYINSKGAQNILLTMGSKGLYFSNARIFGSVIQYP